MSYAPASLTVFLLIPLRIYFHFAENLDGIKNFADSLRFCPVYDIKKEI
jgi:hypothetical protein